MYPQESSLKPIQSVQAWIITVAVTLFAVFGVVLSLICIYALPDRAVRPAVGAAFFIGGAFAIIGLLFITWRKERGILHPGNADNPSRNVAVASVQDGISDKILKWITTIIALFYSLDSVMIALICIYALPDKTVQPMAGVLYVVGGSMVAGSFVYAIWRRG